ncbi:SH3 domain-containing protein [Devosia rhodophyticola]|uniref:SH3 domain-containing protein n=1 Tax=Devosia rhodophyticola TaxID=3026423 RepID=A0ABY7Z1H7_9HYPH|nr:SH3 domain-containing protein [Devosia rhodophyticola]WDR07138.1 SH3 domain-containing protein [Devosia rhodophyticola]
MFDSNPCKPTNLRPHRLAFWRAAMVWALVFTGMVLPTLAQENPSGLPLPRFASTRSDPINVRVGPGTKYEVAWIYLKAGVPIEIIAEFDTWRKVRDVEGQTGWIHQNLLSGNRVGYVKTDDAGGEITLLSAPDPAAKARAMLQNGFRVQLNECDGQYCQVTASYQPDGGRSQSYTGYVEQALVWGALPNENFD